uniref:Uncharacterized protein n=1 Tax=Acrobeloides nanus TaxID=290746 RepID=A0A914DV13_9BILA
MFDSMCERPEFMELMNETLWMLPNFTGGPTERMNPQNFCTIITEINDILTKILLHIMHIPVIILIVITLVGKEKEDAKWFVFHTALLNLILGIIWEISLINTDFEKNPIIMMMMIYSIGSVLSLHAIALLYTQFYTEFIDPVLEELQHGSPLDQNPLPPTLSNIPPSRTMLFTFLILDNWRYTLYQFYVIIDTFMTLFVLRTYRHTLKHVCLNAWDKVQVLLFGEKYEQNVTDVYKKRPSINQWTG